MGTLGRVGLIGGIGKLTKANMVLWTKSLPINAVGTKFHTLALHQKGATVAADYDTPMPFEGKFIQILGMVRQAHKGVWTLVKNGVDTGLTINWELADPLLTIKKVNVSVSFAAGDLFRVKYVTTNAITATNASLMLVGGMIVP